jgi:hypothetical protein
VLSGCVVSLLDSASQLDLLLGGEQRSLDGIAEIEPQRGMLVPDSATDGLGKACVA